MNLTRDRPRPVCGSCKMRKHKCLCTKSPEGEIRVPPELDRTPGQTKLPVEASVGSRVAYWMRWMRTTGIQEGLCVEPAQNQSSQDQRRAYHGVEGYQSERSESERPKTVSDGKPDGTSGGVG